MGEYVWSIIDIDDRVRNSNGNNLCQSARQKFTIIYFNTNLQIYIFT